MHRSLAKCGERVEEFRHRFGAANCTFYVRDPWWPSEFRLLFMPGVELTEPMHGFVFPESPAIACGGDVWVVRDAAGCRELRIEMPPLDLPEVTQRLFGDFIHREQVASCIRLLHRDPAGPVGAILFLNYREPQAFPESEVVEIREAFRELCEDLNAVQEELYHSVQFPARKLLHMLGPAQRLAAPDIRASRFTARHSPDAEPLLEPRRFFTPLLEAVFRAFRFEIGEALAVVYLYDREAGTLERVCKHGRHGADTEDIYRVLSARKGEGVSSWVAAVRRPIVLNDLASSRFRAVYRQPRADVRSALVVPMMAGPELIGVLNIECTRCAAFDLDDTRIVAVAANLAATAYHQQTQLVQRGQWYERLLDACQEAAITPEDPRRPFNLLADAACKALKALECDIWAFDAARGKFTHAGASYGNFEDRDPPRLDGWSAELVLCNPQPTWIGDIRSESAFSVACWDRKARQWHSLSPADRRVHRVNTRLLQREVRSTLGLPIQFGGECNGVAWLRYPNGEAPAHELMELAHGYAGEMGLFLYGLRRSREHVSGEILQEIRQAQTSDGGWDEHPRVRLYVASRPYETGVSGDFFRFSTSDHRDAEEPEPLVCLIADGEGHGVPGAMHMLPLISCFVSYSRHHSSPRDMLEEMNRVALAMGCRGSALCFTLAMDLDGNMWLSGANAGHPSLLIWRDGKFHRFPGTSDPASTFPLGLVRALKLVEVSEQLNKGDWVIAFSDGIFEAGENIPGLKQWGEKGIQGAAPISAEATPELVATAILKEAARHARNRPHDDMTVVAIQVR